MAAHCVKHVVVDSGGFIRNAPLREIGEHIVTIPEVVNEIRDKATRQRLQVLPYELQFQQPTPEAIRVVSDFAKKTGDYRTLSAVDIKVMALTLQLEWQHVGKDHIKVKPEQQAQWTTTTKHLEKLTDVAGFYIGSQKSTPASSRSTSISQASEADLHIESLAGTLHETSINENKVETNVKTAETKSEEEMNDTNRLDTLSGEKESIEDSEKKLSKECSPLVISENADSDIKGERDSHDNDLGQTEQRQRKDQEGDTIPVEMLREDDEEEDDDDDEEEDDDDDDGWITPSNIQQIKKSMGDVNMEKANVIVGCVTTDFSMQNVLIQMGLNVVSIDGMLIRRAKSYVLRCFACMKITTNMTKEFCPHCGNSTLQRVSMCVEDDGSIRYFISKRKPVSARGLKYSLPMPKGGKHAVNPILCEDQREAQQRGSKASRIKYDVLDPDYIAFNSPFAPTDTQSRASQLGIRANRNVKKRSNPNEKRKIYGRRK